MSYDVTVQRCGLTALFDLKGDAEVVGAWVGEALPGFPDRPNHRTEKDGTELFFIGRDHWIARAPLVREEALPADDSALRREEL